METFVALGIVIAVVLVGWVLYPYLLRKGWFGDNQVSGTKMALEIAQIIIQEIDFKNKKQVEMVISASNIAVRYVEQIAKFENNDKKKELAMETVFEALELAGIEITESIKRLVNVSIEASVNALPKTYSN